MPLLKNILTLTTYGYFLIIISTWAIIWFTGDKWWFGTLLLYGPRWIYGAPLFFLAPIVIIWEPRSLRILAITTIITAWPLMGLNFHVDLSKKNNSAEFRVLTYNIHRWGVSAEEFTKLLEKVQPDFAAVQECAPSKWHIPEPWHVIRARTSVVISKYPIARHELSYRDVDINGIYCTIDTPSGPVGFACIDLLTPRRALLKILDREKILNLDHIDIAQILIENRWRESAQLSEWISSFPEKNKIIAGDFNLTTDSTIYRAIWTNFQNAYSQSETGFGHTKKTKFSKFRYGSRIDHILATHKFKPLRAWTGPDYGSDHLPLIAEFVSKQEKEKNH